MNTEDPSSVVQRQLDAYNAKDIEAWLNTYAPDAEQFELHGERLARGHDEMRERMKVRFQEPDLQARLIKRVVVGDFVVDAEEITRNFPEGKGTIEMLCVYQVAGSVISKASFALGRKHLSKHANSDA